ncbi:hypothetical protein G647_02866 [Cladophialophora carrionii CBS 160.54]|uniref:AB hydrolase-1 domain-containing protein n=1 Tax=Cladophialophora carrionii CBS 160.54 TaxID=1279043 RepID=V9DGR6_9EURO|nr:uncharacterized protein G647_02866 [Cladophialophora carrionii CBS 160.54]ETI26089.1 hypothetical protein G647_02866 [Cladophialophora carrionii CBS 160.54]
MQVRFCLSSLAAILWSTVSTAAASWEAEQHASNDLSFYTVPSNFSCTLAPGSLLRVEVAINLSGYTVPSSLTISRIIYTTADQNGPMLPASAYVLWPYTPLASAGLKKDQFPMVVWAHGSSGFFGAGIAVVAPDYAGLGVDRLPNGQTIAHNWLHGPSQATDLANAVIAARKAFPRNLPADGPFVAVGHS